MTNCGSKNGRTNNFDESSSSNVVDNADELWYDKSLYIHLMNGGICKFSEDEVQSIWGLKFKII